MSSDNQRRSLRRSWGLPETESVMILVRLPADVVVRFKLVCKNWYKWISKPEFVSAYLKYSQSVPSNHHILLHADDWGDDLPDPSRSVICCASYSANVVGSVNGLICLAGHYRDGGSPDDIWVMNPLFGHSIKLPPPPYPVDLTRCESRLTFAFWCDSVTNAYKVARIVSYLYKSDPRSEGWDHNPAYPNPNRADVWDSNSPQTWSEIPIGFGRPFYHRPSSWVTACDVVVGECAYWIVVDFNNNGLFVLSLDMNTLSLKPISLPRLTMNPTRLIECLDLCESFIFVTKCKERFALVARKENWTGDLPFFDIKEEGEKHNIWTIKDGSSNGAWNPPISIHLDFLKSYLLNNINGKIFVWQAHDQLALYDIETHLFEETHLFGESLGNGEISMASVHDFVWSFVTINGFERRHDIWERSTFIWQHGIWPRGAERKDLIMEESFVEKYLIAESFVEIVESDNVKF